MKMRKLEKKKTLVRIVDVPVEIQTRCLQI